MNLDYFQLVDRIVSLNVDDRTIEAQARIPDKASIFQGHFPGHPLMPGVLLIEAMAQTSGWLCLAMLKFERMAFLAAVKEAKLRQFLSPGDELAIKARVAHEGSGYTVADAEIHFGGKLACNATITLRHMPFPNDELRGHMLTLARKIGVPHADEVGAHG
jgi:3-hydroxyacyl-[acyl-carrier-protein] dehydratase